MHSYTWPHFPFSLNVDSCYLQSFCVKHCKTANHFGSLQMQITAFCNTPIFGSRSLDVATGGRTALCPGAVGHQEDVAYDPLHSYRTPDTGVQTHQKGHGG